MNCQRQIQNYSISAEYSAVATNRIQVTIDFVALSDTAFASRATTKSRDLTSQSVHSYR